jgi:predicted SprT family Zn-dependent metalloprotease
MITNTQYRTFDNLFSYYNKELFGGRLNDCMIITARSKRSMGYFCSERWKENIPEEGLNIHEICLNPSFFDFSDIEWQSTLVHEMVHLWQNDFGKPGRGRYHNRQWAEKMEVIGLMPSTTGQAGGKKTGQRMSHYIMPNGLFEIAFNCLAEKRIEYVSPNKYASLAVLDKTETTETQNKTTAKTKYSCPCGNNVWGKPGLHIICAAPACGQSFEELNNSGVLSLLK